MCGISGYVGQTREGEWGEVYVILRELFLASEHRGRDATGFAAMTEPLNRPTRRGVVVGKAPSTSSRFVNTDERWLGMARRRSSAVIQHVRAATHGDTDTGDNRNNHPFGSASEGLQLVHNGVVGNYVDLFDQFSLRPRTECDSEVLLRVVEQAKHPRDGLVTCLREVRGSMSVAVLDSRRGVVYLATNGGRHCGFVTCGTIGGRSSPRPPTSCSRRWKRCWGGTVIGSGPLIRSPPATSMPCPRTGGWSRSLPSRPATSTWAADRSLKTGGQYGP